MVKKLMSLILILVLAIPFSGCGESPESMAENAATEAVFDKVNELDRIDDLKIDCTEIAENGKGIYDVNGKLSYIDFYGEEQTGTFSVSIKVSDDTAKAGYTNIKMKSSSKEEAKSNDEAEQKEMAKKVDGQDNDDASKYVGKWRAVSAEMDGVSITPAEMEMEVYLDFNADGMATITTIDAQEGEDSASDPWEKTPEGLKIISGTEELIFKETKSGVLTGEFSGVMFTFEKM